jgi:probable rRNA maturation factor
MEVVVSDVQEQAPVDLERWRRLAAACLESLGVTFEGELQVSFVDEAQITELNERYLGHEGPTDVLSFPIDEELGESAPPDAGAVPVLLGDIIICPEVARRNAPEHAGTYDDELALLLVHGILHLLGMDHELDDEAEVMEAKERELLALNHRSSSE